MPERSLPAAGGVVATLLLASLAAGGFPVASAHRDADRKPPSSAEQRTFMWAMAGQESGWDYYARNATSGAFGKYQIMPFNWPAWAEEYLGTRFADQTPANQERVAYGKLHDLHRWLGSWRRVAYWWLTGDTEPDRRRWSRYAAGYVENIMQLRERAPRRPEVPEGRVDAAPGRGSWRLAGRDLTLRRSAAGPTWRQAGHVADGVVLRVRAALPTRDGRWLRVVTLDGRLGWLNRLRTVPARAPTDPGRWADVKSRGPAGHHRDRSRVQVRPR